jgi:hypothetical protein
LEPGRPLGVITPTLDGDVLARLALADRSFTAGELRRLIPSASIDGLRKALNRLARQGTVSAARAGQAIVYRLNREHVAARAITELANSRAMVIQRIREVVTAWPDPTPFAAVFGSWARGTATTGSDLDLFVVRPDGVADTPWEAQIGQIERAATGWTGNDTRALVLAESEIDSRPPAPVLASIAEDGIVVVGPADWLRERLYAQASAPPR